jgi:hypothetical protein
MDEYEAAEAEFMARVLESEADGLNDLAAISTSAADEQTVKREKAIRKREKASNIKIGSAFHNEPVGEDEEGIDKRTLSDVIEGVMQLSESYTDHGITKVPLEDIKNINIFLKYHKLQPIPRNVRIDKLVDIFESRLDNDFKRKNTKKLMKSKVLSGIKDRSYRLRDARDPRSAVAKKRLTPSDRFEELEEEGEEGKFDDSDDEAVDRLKKAIKHSTDILRKGKTFKSPRLLPPPLKTTPVRDDDWYSSEEEIKTPKVKPPPPPYPPKVKPPPPPPPYPPKSSKSPPKTPKKADLLSGITTVKLKTAPKSTETKELTVTEKLVEDIAKSKKKLKATPAHIPALPKKTLTSGLLDELKESPIKLKPVKKTEKPKETSALEEKILSIRKAIDPGEESEDDDDKGEWDIFEEPGKRVTLSAKSSAGGGESTARAKSPGRAKSPAREVKELMESIPLPPLSDKDVAEELEISENFEIPFFYYDKKHQPRNYVDTAHISLALKNKDAAIEKYVREINAFLNKHGVTSAIKRNTTIKTIKLKLQEANLNIRNRSEVYRSTSSSAKVGGKIGGK